MHDGLWIHDILTISISLTVVALNVFYFCIFLQIKCVDSLMLGSVHATVVDSASRNDRDICSLPNVKIIVYTFLQSALAQDNRNMNALIDRSRFDNDVNSVLVLFCDNINIGGGVSCSLFSIGTDVIGTFRNLMKSRHLF